MNCFINGITTIVNNQEILQDIPYIKIKIYRSKHLLMHYDMSIS